VKSGLPGEIWINFPVFYGANSFKLIQYYPIVPGFHSGLWFLFRGFLSDGGMVDAGDVDAGDVETPNLGVSTNATPIQRHSPIQKTTPNFPRKKFATSSFHLYNVPVHNKKT
jgi:hypothetical protein